MPPDTWPMLARAFELCLLGKAGTAQSAGAEGGEGRGLMGWEGVGTPAKGGTENQSVAAGMQTPGATISAGGSLRGSSGLLRKGVVGCWGRSNSVPLR